MMYRPFRGATDLAVELQTPDYRFGAEAVAAVSASAAREPDSAIVVALVNRAPHQRAHVSIETPGAKVSTVRGQVLTAEAMDARNSFERPHALEPQAFAGARLDGDRLEAELPAKSVVVLELR
jgi:alpha-N-arabinofuranosidase